MKVEIAIGASPKCLYRLSFARCLVLPMLVWLIEVCKLLTVSPLGLGISRGYKFILWMVKS
jgi:hypothetical protein